MLTVLDLTLSCDSVFDFWFDQHLLPLFPRNGLLIIYVLDLNCFVSFVDLVDFLIL